MSCMCTSACLRQSLAGKLFKLVDLLATLGAHVSNHDCGLVLSSLGWLTDVTSLAHLLEMLKQAVTVVHQFLRNHFGLHEALLSNSLSLYCFQFFHGRFFALALWLHVARFFWVLSHHVAHQTQMGFISQVRQKSLLLCRYIFLSFSLLSNFLNVDRIVSL